MEQEMGHEICVVVSLTAKIRHAATSSSRRFDIDDRVEKR
jgi:hypothetical protein